MHQKPPHLLFPGTVIPQQVGVSFQCSQPNHQSLRDSLITFSLIQDNTTVPDWSYTGEYSVDPGFLCWGGQELQTPAIKCIPML